MFLEKSQAPECYLICCCTISIPTAILRDEIIASQKNDEGMAHIKRRIQEGDMKVGCFHEDVEGTL
jgi:hypothetical protein